MTFTPPQAEVYATHVARCADESDSDEMAMMQHGGMTKHCKQELVDSDEVGWMQQPAHLSSTPRQMIQLVGLHGASAVVTIDPMRTIMSQLREIWPFTNRVAEDVTELIAVSNPPSTPGVDIHIMRFADDHFEQVSQDDILLLTTIVFQGPTGTTHHKRKVAWGPSRANRLQILHFFRVHWFCERPSVICFLDVNGVCWALMDSTVRSLTEGSHLLIRIRSDREDCPIDQISQFGVF